MYSPTGHALSGCSGEIRGTEVVTDHNGLDQDFAEISRLARYAELHDAKGSISVLSNRDMTCSLFIRPQGQYFAAGLKEGLVIAPIALGTKAKAAQFWTLLYAGGAKLNEAYL